MLVWTSYPSSPGGGVFPVVQDVFQPIFDTLEGRAVMFFSRGWLIILKGSCFVRKRLTMGVNLVYLEFVSPAQRHPPLLNFFFFFCRFCRNFPRLNREKFLESGFRIFVCWKSEKRRSVSCFTIKSGPLFARESGAHVRFVDRTCH